MNKILIVDDEPIGRQLLEAILHQEDYQLIFAEDGQQAYDKSLEIIPDLILLDVMMPEMDGYEVCKRLREEQSTSHVPIILITALDDRDSRIRGLEAGADDYISKPLDRVEILAKVKNITQLSRQRGAAPNTDKSADNTLKPDAVEKSFAYNRLLDKVIKPQKAQLEKITNNNIFVASEKLANSLISTHQKDDKSILFLTSIGTYHFPINLINVYTLLNFRNIIEDIKNLTAGKLLNQLTKSLVDDVTQMGSIDLNQQQFSLSLLIYDKQLEELQYAGLNNSMLLQSGNSVQKFTGAQLNASSQIKDTKFTYQTIDINWGDVAYIYSQSLANELADFNDGIMPDQKLITIMQEAQDLNILENNLQAHFDNISSSQMLLVGIQL
ncbi:MAG: response regulator [Bacteroidetes bacterium]|jgi:DNA-binding response OmpR family regulator|nr:response regulator [Bacteroidota bacterium]